MSFIAANITPSEISQSQKDKVHDFTYTRYQKQSNSQKQNRIETAKVRGGRADRVTI